MEVKKEKDDEYCGKPEEKANEHPHRFFFKFKEEVRCEIICTEPRTIHESLQRHVAFEEEASKNQDKELVILTQSDKKAINSNCPCHIISGDYNLKIKYISKGKNPTTTTSSKDKKVNNVELVTFEIGTNGGKNMKKTNIMKNFGLRRLVDFVIVCGYKGQKVREALKEDGRFSDEVLQTNYYLEETTVTTLVERSQDVDFLDGRCFKIAKNAKSIDTGKHDAPKEATSSKNASSDIPTPNQPTPNTSLQPTPNKGDQLNSEEIYNLLCSQFPDLTKHMKGRKKDANSRDVRKLFSREFGRNRQLCHDMVMLRRLVELGDSVCLVRIDGIWAGSGFLLFGKYILTNAHVVLDYTKKNLMENIEVVFTFEMKAESLFPLPVTVVAWTYLVDKEGYKQDWALLEVCGDLNTVEITPQPLLEHFRPVTESGHICIIGHPDGKFKTMDPCLTIPREKCEELINPDYLFRDILTYESCFYEGSSGSPVFDENLYVVSMHTGGFYYENNAIEFSLPLSLIIEQIIIQIVRHKKVDVLLAMITGGIPKAVEDVVEDILSNDEGLVWKEEEIIILCERDQACTKLLKDFFRLYSQRDEPTEPEAMVF